jgi:hypothetical protein
MVIFHSYVSLPEGKSVLRSNSALSSGEFSMLPAAVALLSPIDKAGGLFLPVLLKVAKKWLLV